MRQSAGVARAVVLSLGLVAGAASADPTPSGLSLEMSGARFGTVAVRTSTTQVIVTTSEVSPALVAVAAAFTQGKVVKKDLRFATSAVLRRTNDARLSSIRLPSLGYGGSADVELAFTASPLQTQPVLSAKDPPAAPPSARITDFRFDVNGVKAVDTPKLDSLTLTQKADGTATAGAVTFEAGAGDGPPFTAWQKANGGHPAARTVHIEYVGADGNAVLKLDLDRCTPTSVAPLGASGTTKVTLACGKASAS